MWAEIEGSSSSEEFWGETLNRGGRGGDGGVGTGWVCSYTTGVLFLILLWRLAWAVRLKSNLFFRSQAAATSHYPPPPPINNPPLSLSQPQVSTIISDLDLKSLIDNLDEELHEDEKWENIINKGNSLFSYRAKCCKPRVAPLKYVSVTIFEKISVEMLRDFYMDNDYRKQWDRTLIEHDQLQVYEDNGTEIGRTIKKFPLLKPREYVLAWRLWEGKDGIFYCFSKQCEHPLAPRQRKCVRVGFLRSGWRIKKVPGRNACEIKMLHQEDAGLNEDMAKLAFKKGIWNYVCKMDNALRKYSIISRLQSPSAVNAVTFVQKVPPELDGINSMTGRALPEISIARVSSCQEECEGSKRKISGRPSRKLMTKGMIFLGGVICLSRGHANFGAKVAIAYILSKLTKGSADSGRNR